MNETSPSVNPNLPKDRELSAQFPRLSEGAAHLNSYGVIRVLGDDTFSFLQNQLTQDFLNLKDGEARFCSFCSAKGRIQASFIGIKNSPTEALLICSSDLIAQTVKRLSMFVMRSKVKITDASVDFNIFGIIGEHSQFKPETATQTFNISPWRHMAQGSDESRVHWISLYPCQGIPRYLCVCASSTNFTQNAIITESDWALSEILSGVCMIRLATYESFVPQMINYESVGGVHFQKGCYPGQEIVARSQFRGTIKRRGFLIKSIQELHDGEELFIHTDLEQPCGQVVRSSLHAGIYYAFASLLLSATETPSQIQTNRGQSQIEILPLPYPLRDDI